MKDYNPFNWYWIINGSTTHAYSSASGDLVPVDNAAYVAWASDGTLATRIGSAAELGEVLAPLRLRPTHAGTLDGYLEKQAGDLIDAVQFKLLGNHENRIRAVERALGLNGNPPNLTPAQMKAAVKVLL